MAIKNRRWALIALLMFTLATGMCLVVQSGDMGFVWENPMAVDTDPDGYVEAGDIYTFTSDAGWVVPADVEVINEDGETIRLYDCTEGTPCAPASGTLVYLPANPDMPDMVVLFPYGGHYWSDTSRGTAIETVKDLGCQMVDTLDQNGNVVIPGDGCGPNGCYSGVDVYNAAWRYEPRVDVQIFNGEDLLGGPRYDLEIWDRPHLNVCEVPVTVTPTFTASPTNTPTNTPTEVPTNTPTATPSPTGTFVPPTVTATFTPTNTPVPPTATPTATPGSHVIYLPLVLTGSGETPTPSPTPQPTCPDLLRTNVQYGWTRNAGQEPTEWFRPGDVYPTQRPGTNLWLRLTPLAQGYYIVAASYRSFDGGPTQNLPEVYPGAGEGHVNWTYEVKRDIQPGYMTISLFRRTAAGDCTIGTFELKIDDGGPGVPRTTESLILDSKNR